MQEERKATPREAKLKERCRQGDEDAHSRQFIASREAASSCYFFLRCGFWLAPFCICSMRASSRLPRTTNWSSHWAL
jgi:hypothetical protein